MKEKTVPTKKELLARIDAAWTALQTALDRQTDEQMTRLKDAQGWSVKDHIVHLAAWERSVVFFLQGRPRYAGLEVAEEIFRGNSVDDVNAAIHAQHKDMPIVEVHTGFRDVHRQLLGILSRLTDADLRKGYDEYQPGEPAGADGRTAYEVIDNNTAGHYEEHRPWIDALVHNAGCQT
jgi:hypothetical protein